MNAIVKGLGALVLLLLLAAPAAAVVRENSDGTQSANVRHAQFEAGCSGWYGKVDAVNLPLDTVFHVGLKVDGAIRAELTRDYVYTGQGSTVAFHSGSTDRPEAQKPKRTVFWADHPGWDVGVVQSNAAEFGC